MGYDVQTSSVFATIFINLAFGAAFLFAFEFFRKNYAVFSPKPLWNDNKHVPSIEPEKGLFAWIFQVISIYDEDVIAISGMDAYVMVRFVRMCFIASSYCSVLAAICLLPIYFTAYEHTAVGINLYSMAHVENGSRRLFASVFFMWAFVCIFLYHLHKEYENFAYRRRNFFENGDPRLPVQMQYTVLIENVPPDYRTSPKLKVLFDELFPGEVHSAAVMMDLPELSDALSRRDDACAKLENAIAAREAHEFHRDPLFTLVDGEPSMFVGCCKPCYYVCYSKIECVNAIHYWERELDKLNAVVAELQAQGFRAAEGDPTLQVQKHEQKKRQRNMELREQRKKDREKLQKQVQHSSDSAPEFTRQDEWHIDKENKDFKIFFGPKNVSKTGIVTFTTRKCQVIAAGMPIVSGRFPYMRVYAAPTPTDIIWENVTADLDKVQKYRFAVSTVLTAGFLFWGLVLATVAAISSLSNLQKLLPFLRSLNSNTKAVLSGQLPVLALMLFTNYLPVIITYFAQNLEKRKTISEVQSEVFRW
jgi:hypothetical protein